MPDPVLLAKVTAYKGILIIEGADPDLKDPQWVPAGGGRIGCVLMDTKARLGVSDEAMALLKTIKRGRDSIGDVDWWACDDKSFAFGWLGPHLRLVDPKQSQTSRQYKVGPYVTIPNEVRPDAIEAIDAPAE